MMRQFTILVFIIFFVSNGHLHAREYYVSPSGNNLNPGTLSAPFQTIQAAVNHMEAGDICIVRGGIYRETVSMSRGGTAEKPIQIKAFPGEIPILKGTDLVTGSWTSFKDNIYKTNLEPGLTIEQVFVDQQPMTWARWPNAAFNDRWSSKKWRKADNKSILGTLVDLELAKMNIDWTGAVVTLNTGPNWDTWTAIVKDHAKDKDRFNYTRDLQWKQFHIEYAGLGTYYLSGKLAALDAPGEWFYDQTSGDFYIWLPEEGIPDQFVVEVKVRNYGFFAEKSDYLILEGIHFFGTTFNFRECHHCSVDRCHIRFPNVAPLLSELNMPSKPTICTQMIGHYNTFQNSSLAYSPTFGIRMLGSYNLVENNLIYDVNWIGSLVYANVWMGSLEDNYTWEGGLKYEGMLEETVPQASTEDLEKVQWGGSTGDIIKAHDPDAAKPAGHCAVRHNTLFASGNIILGFFEQPFYDIAYNHIYEGGSFVNDVSMIYTTLPQIRGSVIHHNWVQTEYKLCIRADDQSRGVTIHHNVMWGSHIGSLVVKGEDNAVYHNTTLTPESSSNWGLNVQVWAEPDKPHYRKLWPLLPEQNAHTPVWNNFTHKITDHHKGRLYPADDPRLSHNLIIANPDSLLVDPAGLDFSPRKGSPLIDSAIRIEGINDDFTGEAPDIGAYEFGAEYWLAGYRNFVRSFGQTINQETHEGELQIALAMPPLKPVLVTVKEREGLSNIIGETQLQFNKETWSTPQTIRFLVIKPTDYAEYLDFKLE